MAAQYRACVRGKTCKVTRAKAAYEQRLCAKAAAPAKGRRVNNMGAVMPEHARIPSWYDGLVCSADARWHAAVAAPWPGKSHFHTSFVKGKSAAQSVMPKLLAPPYKGGA
eukprot:347697-Chlamydomonas_euryale.AAC.3